MKRARMSICLVVALMLAGQALAQLTVTGTITGTITDPSNQVILGASVTLMNDRTGEVRTASTNELGGFTLPAVQPGAYSLKVEATGFKTLQRTGMVVGANERVALGMIQLSIGAVTETVNVAAQAAVVQTTTAEHSSAITSSQLDTMAVRGRDVVSLLRILPGVTYGVDPESVGGSFGTATPSIAGADRRTNILAVDGVVSNDLGTPQTFSSVTTLDAIGEVKMVTHSMQAEFAGNGGAVVQVLSKSGGRDYHGSAFGYKRHENFNANNFFNNRTNVQKPMYRYDTLGFTLGGPIYIPGKFNRNRNQLFGFYTLESMGEKTPMAIQQVTVPTALERAGDFSQTLDVSGRLIPITDPLTGKAFPGNVIPASRIDKNGLALLNVLPMPNFTDRSITKGNFNYQFQEAREQPKRSQLFRIDYVPTDKDRLYVRGKTWLSDQKGYNIAGPGASPWGLFKMSYAFTESGLGVGYTRVFGPSVVMELTSGVRHNREAWIPRDDLDIMRRSARGFTAGQWYPSSNPDGWLPRVTFGGVPSSADITYDDRFLTGGTDFTFTLNDNVTLIHGRHIFKAGFSVYRMREYEGERSVFGGIFDFGRDTNDPGNTNWAHSNALIGHFRSYQESTSRYGANMRETIAEWFVQDNWRVTPKLSIDYGIRFSWHNQFYAKNPGEQALLALDRYNPKDAPAYYRPALDPSGKRMAQNPLTGELVLPVMIGAFVPGSGNPAPGAVLSGDKTYPRGWVDQQPVLLGPRLGIAYDPFGNGKTAIRAGAGIVYNMRVTKWTPATLNPPATFTPILYYGDLSTFLQSSGVLFPGNTNSFQRDAKTGSAINLSFGVQQDLGYATILDVSYAGTLGRHLYQNVNLNTIPYGARFLPQNQDPTLSGRPLIDNFLRPMPGYQNVTYLANGYGSNYHSLQVSANRRFTRDIQFGLAYTLSKYMTYTGIPLYRPLRVWAYGKDGNDQTHNLVVNFLWALPKASKALPNPVVRHVLDNWQLSGIAAFVSGAPSSIGLSTTDGADLSGGGDGTRVNVTGKAPLPHADRTFDRWFDTSVFARPSVGDPGNAPKDVFRGPGYNNWDISIFKQIPLGREDRYVQFRWEMYNAFNHTQYASVDSGARFDTQGRQVNARFGQVINARSSRVMQGALRFTF